MPPPLQENQQVFDGENFAGGTTVGNPGDDSFTLSSNGPVFPDGSIIVATFNDDATSITRIDVFNSEQEFLEAQSIDDASTSYWDQNTSGEDALAGEGRALGTQGLEGDSFVIFQQPDFFRVNGENSGQSLNDLVNGSRFLFTPNFDIANAEEPVEIETDLDGDGNSSFDGNNIICFAEGTMIATPDGERAVEELKVGDAILSAEGDVIAVKWVGRQTVSKAFTPPERFNPVRIAAGALGPNTPSADLVVTADHGIVVDGVLANAGALANGRTIARVPSAELPARVTYYHVETENHALIVANGATAETFVDATTRSKFDNYADYLERFGEPGADMAILAKPRAFTRRQLPAHVVALLDRRANELALDEPNVA